MGEKTEQATPKKLSDARKKGQVARSQDVPSAFTFIVSIVLVISLFDFILGNLGGFIISCAQAVGAKDPQKEITGRMIEAFFVILKASLPIVGGVVVVGILANFLMVGPLVTFEVFKLDINKFNPVNNIKQKFKVKTLIELLKSIIKIMLASYLIFTIVRDQVGMVTQTVSTPVMTTVLIVKEFFIMMATKVGILFIIVAFADFIYQKKNFAKEMMMEKHEIKQEYKNSEGDPHIKGKRKQIAQEMAYSDSPRNVKHAKAVVTNPTEYAVAIAYNPEMGVVAPFIVAMGKDYTAAMIVKEAKKHDVPILQNIYLTRKLYSEGKINDFVPEDTYELIAEVLKWVASLNKPPIEL